MKTERQVTLAEIADINPPTGNGLGPPRLISFLGMKDVDAATGATGPGEERLYSSVSKGYTAFSKGDLLVAKITPCFQNNKIAQATIAHEAGFGSTEFHVIRAKLGQSDPRFLLHYLRQDAILRAGEARMTGSGGQRRVPEEFLQTLQIPGLPIAEQRRIADVLDRAATLRVRRRQVMAQLDALAQSIFFDIFAGGIQRSHVWPRCPLGEVSEIQGGLQVTSKRARLPISVPYLRVANVHRETLDLSQVKMIRITRAELLRTRLQYGDILVVEGHGNADEIGRCARWDGSLPDCVHQNHLIRVRPNASVLNSVFASHLLNSPEGRLHLLRSANTTSGLNTISVKDVAACSVYLPPIELQDRFSRLVDKVASVRGQLLRASGVEDYRAVARAADARETARRSSP